jgi:hypothetical protein
MGVRRVLTHHRGVTAAVRRDEVGGCLISKQNLDWMGALHWQQLAIQVGKAHCRPFVTHCNVA